MGHLLWDGDPTGVGSVRNGFKPRLGGGLPRADRGDGQKRGQHRGGSPERSPGAREPEQRAAERAANENAPTNWSVA